VPLILPYPSVAQPSFCAESQDPVSGDGLNESALIDSAVAVELTHVASLYHDDVMDEAPRRRGAPSANVRWGNSVAIMVGDFLLATASLVGSSLGEAFVAHQSRTLARLVQGQIAELRGPLDGADPVTHHLSVLSDKTASLIAASARYGGMVAGLPDDQIEELTAFGESLGMAFQLADDLIDILSDDSGKTKGTDLREGVLTLAPLMVITENRPEDGRLVALLSGPVSEEDVPEALALLRVHPALDKVRHHIAEHTRLACSHLEVFPDSPAKRALITLADQAVYRTS
jgi:heptaprenyl diphosphate synthase